MSERKTPPKTLIQGRRVRRLSQNSQCSYSIQFDTRARFPRGGYLPAPPGAVGSIDTSPPHHIKCLPCPFAPSSTHLLLSTHTLKPFFIKGKETFRLYVWGMCNEFSWDPSLSVDTSETAGISPWSQESPVWAGTHNGAQPCLNTVSSFQDCPCTAPFWITLTCAPILPLLFNPETHHWTNSYLAVQRSDILLHRLWGKE